MRDEDYIVGAYLASRQLELAEFERKVYEAREVNRKLVTIDMTPQEEKYKAFFNQYSLQVKDLSDIDLEAFIEEMKEICFGGKAALDAATQEKRERKKKTSPKAFQVSLTIDNIATDAINKIKNREQKLSKLDKAVEGMVKAGIPRAEAERLVSARNIRDEVQKPVLTERVNAENASNGNNEPSMIPTPEPQDNAWTFKNPFEK